MNDSIKKENDDSGTYNKDGWTDFWRYEIGVNVIQADTRSKTTNIQWSKYQFESVPEEEYEERKGNGDFDNGTAIILGKIHRGPYKGKYLACIDIDNRKGIEEFLLYFGKIDTIEKLSKMTMAEGHSDDPNKVHVYFIVEQPLSKRSGIGGAKDNPDIPAIEVKSEGSHGIMFCTPSTHKNGHPYQIIGTKKPTVLNESNSKALENAINAIYQKYESSERNKKDGLIPIEDLFKKDFKIKIGNNRHEGLLRIMESLIARNSSILSEDKIKEIAYEWNQIHCEPPLDDIEFEKQWKDSKKYIGKNQPDSEEKPIIENEELEFLKDIEQRYISIFYDQLNRLYVTIKINDHIENIPLESKRFKSLIRKEILEKDNKTTNDDKIDRIVKSIQAEMIFDENIKQKELSLRVAGMDDNSTIYYDLTNHKWEIVKITSEGWQIVQDNVIPLFKRYEKNCRPQIYPKKDVNNEGYFKEFLNLFNLRTEKDRLLLESYLISLLIPKIQKAILVISGNWGGAKTTTLSLIRKIVDPSTLDTLSFSPNKNDLIQSLEHNYVNYFDNVSYISQEVSDILCRAVTGSGDSKRELYTIDEDFIYKFKRCIGINSINLVTTRPDFIDRSLVLKVKKIPEEKRKKEEDIEKEFERLRPYVLGYIFDILVKYLIYKEKHKAEIILKSPPRMADFAESCEIISRCLGHQENAFINAYRENIDNQNDEVIEASPVAQSIIAFMENKSQWIGTPTQLLQQLDDILSQVDSNIRKSKYWPKIPARLTHIINEMVPNLLKRRIEVVTGEKIKGQRVIIITKIDSNPSPSQDKDYNSNSLSNSTFEPLSSYINLHIHRRGSSDIFECEKCSLTGDIHLMKDHACKKDLTILN